MLDIRKYAAIDIGSNAIRLLIANVIESSGKPPQFKKSALVRVPVRLGADVFNSKSILDENIERVNDTMMAFKLLMKTHRVSKYKACATSAMREAENAKEVVELVKSNSGVQIDIIDGQEEAAIIASTDLSDFIKADKTYLYVDVGGGSTEFTLFHDQKRIVSKSFKIGTVRLLNNMVSQAQWEEAMHWIQYYTSNYDKIRLIGSGGNINKIFKLSNTTEGKPLSYLYLIKFYENLKSHTYEERITDLNLNQDRADVILPASQIYLSAMKWSNAKHIYVPKIGLSDGIIKSIYYNNINSKAL